MTDDQTSFEAVCERVKNEAIASERAAFALLLADLEGRVWYNFASKDLAAIRERAGL